MHIILYIHTNNVIYMVYIYRNETKIIYLVAFKKKNLSFILN